jgi:hypothetical protein
MALRTHNLLFGRLKNDFGEVDEDMIQGVERQCEVIFCILIIEKSDTRTHNLPSGHLKKRHL